VKYANFCPDFCPVVAKIPQTPFLNSEVPIKRAFAKRYSIPFPNTRVKSESGQFPRLKKKIKINWLP